MPEWVSKVEESTKNIAGRLINENSFYAINCTDTNNKLKTTKTKQTANKNSNKTVHSVHCDDKMVLKN